jgi:hypothetical protein
VAKDTQWGLTGSNPLRLNGSNVSQTGRLERMSGGKDAQGKVGK